MKKLALSLTILLAFALCGVAQTDSFAPQGAEWYERNENDDCWDGTVEAYAGGDGSL